MMHRFIAITVIAFAATGQAQQPELAPFSLEVIRTSPECSKKDKEDLQRLLPMMLRAADAAVPDSAKLSAALTNLKRQDCGRDDECLAQLARLAGSLYGFYAQVDYDLEGNVVVSGRVVRDDGKVVAESKTITRPKGKAPFTEVARTAISDLCVALGVAKLSPFRQKEPVPDVKPAPVPPEVKPPVPTPVVETRQPLRIPGMVGAGAGVGMLLAGGVVFASAGSFRTDARQNVFREDVDRVAAVQSGQTAGTGLLSAGAAVAVLGLGLWMFGPEETKTVLVPVPGGAGIVVQGSLP